MLGANLTAPDPGRPTEASLEEILNMLVVFGPNGPSGTI